MRREVILISVLFVVFMIVGAASLFGGETGGESAPEDPKEVSLEEALGESQETMEGSLEESQNMGDESNTYILGLSLLDTIMVALLGIFSFVATFSLMIIARDGGLPNIISQNKDSGQEDGKYGSDSPDKYISYDDFQILDTTESTEVADTYKAESKDNSRKAMLEVIKNGDSGDGDLSKEFLQRAEDWDRICNHYGIVEVLGWGGEPIPWIATEFMDSGTLDEKQFGTEIGVKLMIDLSDAVSEAHDNGVTHERLNPRYIYFKKEGNRETAKIGDWSRKPIAENLPNKDPFDLRYSAPEQLEQDTNENPTQELIDVYRLGAVAYYVFTGSVQIR